jgi:hypothetical protein
LKKIFAKSRKSKEAAWIADMKESDYCIIKKASVKKNDECFNPFEEKRNIFCIFADSNN